MTLDRVTVLAGIPDELGAFGALVASLSQDGLVIPSRCVGWTVADIAGHVIGTVVDITEGRMEGLGTAEVNERQARERAGRTAQELSVELTGAGLVLSALLASLPENAWEEPSPSNPDYSLGFAVEAIWYDAYLHGDDIRDALELPSTRGAGLRCAVHHVAGYLEHQAWGAATIALDGIERIDIGGGGAPITGDPLGFVLAATGREDPSDLGLESNLNVYADERGASKRAPSNP